jgi:hypothetical protein
MYKLKRVLTVALSVIMLTVAALPPVSVFAVPNIADMFDITGNHASFVNYDMRGVRVSKNDTDWDNFSAVAFAEKCRTLADIGLNTVVLASGFPYSTDMNADGFSDFLGRFKSAVKKYGLSFFIEFDALKTYFPSAESELHKLLVKYAPDGVVFSGGVKRLTYADYVLSGSGGGYEAYQTENLQYFYKTLYGAAVNTSANIAAGIHADAENASIISDFIIGGDENSSLSYAAIDNSATDDVDTLLKAITKAATAENNGGFVLNSMSALEKNDNGTTDKLKEYLSGLIDSNALFEELTITSLLPDNMTIEDGVNICKFETRDRTIKLTGTFDRNFPITLDGEKLSEIGGYFTVERKISPGVNIFIFEHKGKTIRYEITRKITVIQAVSPDIAVGKSIFADGGTVIAVSVTAMSGAEVAAELFGATLKLKEMNGGDIISDEYSQFSGQFTVPAAADSVQDLGEVKISASHSGYTDIYVGAKVYVNVYVPPETTDTTATE